MLSRTLAIAARPVVMAVAFGLGAASAMAESDAAKACLVAVKKRAAEGDGLAAKALAIHYGEGSGADANPPLAWRYLKQAIEKGVDVSDVPTAKGGSIVGFCSADPKLARLLESPASAAPKSSKPVVAASDPKSGRSGKAPVHASRPKQSTPAAGATGGAPLQKSVAMAVPSVAGPAGTSAQDGVISGKGVVGDKGSAAADAAARPVVVAARISGTAVELERQAADAEWNGRVQEAIPFWEKARQLGSPAAAKRLYQIFSFGAGDVEADYVKAIEAFQYAQQMGLDVPPLPRK